jgi:hypothetical protein
MSGIKIFKYRSMYAHYVLSPFSKGHTDYLMSGIKIFKYRSMYAHYVLSPFSKGHTDYLMSGIKIFKYRSMYAHYVLSPFSKGLNDKFNPSINIHLTNISSTISLGRSSNIYIQKNHLYYFRIQIYDHNYIH